MGVDTNACAAFGIMFTKDQIMAQLLGLSDQDIESIIEGNYGYTLEWASGYHEAGSMLYLTSSLIEIDRSDKTLIRPIPNTDLTDLFWTTVGPELSEKIHKLHQQPSWLLMYQLS